MKIQKLTSNQKAAASFVLIAVVVAGFYWALPKEMANNLVDTSNNIQSHAIGNQNNLIAEVKQQVSGLAANATKPNAVKQTDSSKTPADFQSWKIGDVKAPTPSIPLNDQISKYTIVEVGQPSVFPAVGQQVDIPMLDGETVRVDVQSVSSNPNGDYTWSGHLQGYGTDYPVVMTYGEHSIFATVTTPKGSYTMESVNGSGWLYKNPSEFELSKPGTKDFLEVDTSK